jgi:hypothetical protein
MKKVINMIFEDHSQSIYRHESLKKVMRYKYPEEEIQDRIRKFREAE